MLHKLAQGLQYHSNIVSFNQGPSYQDNWSPYTVPMSERPRANLNETARISAFFDMFGHSFLCRGLMSIM